MHLQVLTIRTITRGALCAAAHMLHKITPLALEPAHAAPRGEQFLAHLQLVGDFGRRDLAPNRKAPLANAHQVVRIARGLAKLARCALCVC